MTVNAVGGSHEISNGIAKKFTKAYIKVFGKSYRRLDIAYSAKHVAMRVIRFAFAGYQTRRSCQA